MGAATAAPAPVPPEPRPVTKAQEPPPLPASSAAAAVATVTPTQYFRSARYIGDHFWYLLATAIGTAFLCGAFVLSLPELGGTAGQPGVLRWLTDWGGPLIFVIAWPVMRISLRALAEIRVNSAIAEAVEERSEAKLRSLGKRGLPGTHANVSINRPNVSQLAEMVIPTNPTKPELAMTRLFHRICTDARDRRFESTANLVDPYQREAYLPVLELERLQRMALRFGILGTFAGLMFSLEAVPEMMRSLSTVGTEVQANAGVQTNAQEIAQSHIAKLLGDLRLAFGTSIAGLAVAIFAASQAAHIRRRLAAYGKKMESATVTVLSLGMNSYNDDEILAEMRQVTAMMSDLKNRLHDQTEKIEAGILTVAETIGQQTTRVQEGLTALANAGKEMDAILAKTVDAHKTFLRELNAQYDMAAMKGLAKSVDDQMAKGLDAHRREFATRLDGLAQRIVSLATLIGERTEHARPEEWPRWLPNPVVRIMFTMTASMLTTVTIIWALGKVL